MKKLTYQSFLIKTRGIVLCPWILTSLVFLLATQVHSFAEHDGEPISPREVIFNQNNAQQEIIIRGSIISSFDNSPYPGQRFWKKVP